MLDKKLNFVKELKENELAELVKPKFFEESDIKLMKYQILQDYNQEYFLIYPITIKDQSLICFNLTSLKVKKNYSRLFEEYNQRLMVFDFKKIQSISTFDTPLTPDLKRLYTKYSKIISEKNNDFNSFLHNRKEKQAHKDYYNINSITDLNSFQKFQRDELFDNIKINEDLKEQFELGELHYQTFISRVLQDKSNESKKMLELLYFSECKDYGFTDQEIILALIHSKKKAKAFLFKAFMSNNRNFSFICAIYKIYLKTDHVDHQKKMLRLLQIMSNNEYVNKDNYSEYLTRKNIEKR